LNSAPHSQAPAAGEADAAPDRPVLRLVLVAAQAACLALTWSLWQARQELPALPLVSGLPAFGMGVPLLSSLALTIWRPRWGVPLHAVLLLLAIAMDQLRIQPEFLSLSLLLWASLPSRAGQFLGRMHLVALYVFMGLHGALGVRGLGRSASDFWAGALPEAGQELVEAMAVGVSMFQVLLGLAILWQPSRRLVAWLLAGMHLVICASLFFQAELQNLAVWPWNLALAVTAPLLLASWRAPWALTRRGLSCASLALGGLLLLSPFGYRFGLVDASLAYAFPPATPAAMQLTATQLRSVERRGVQDFDAPALSVLTTRQLGVPFPPAQRLYVAWYLATREPGDILLIQDPRAWALERGAHRQVLSTEKQTGGMQVQGVWIDYHENGNLASRGFVQDGELQGFWQFWHDDGRPRGEGDYERGERVGEWTIWDEVGDHASHGH
jgi:hypothetical protein